MARELSQEAVLDFLWGAGGRASNSALLRHFQRFLRDPALTEQQRQERRECFKSIVNSLATVRPAAGPAASKDIVLRRRYRDLLDEDLQQQQWEEEEALPSRRDPDPGKAAKERPAGAAGAGGCAARGGPCCECRRALRAPAAAGTPGPSGAPRSPPPPAQLPPYRTPPLSSAARTAHPHRAPQPPPDRTDRSRSVPLPPAPEVMPPASLPPRRPRASPPIQSLAPDPKMLPPAASLTLQRPRASPQIQSLPSDTGVLPPTVSMSPQRPRASPPTQFLPLDPAVLPLTASLPPQHPRASPPTQSLPPGVLPPTAYLPPRCPRGSPPNQYPLLSLDPAPTGSPPPQCPRALPPTQSLPPPKGHRVLPPDSTWSAPQPPTGMPLLKAPPLMAGPRGQHPTRASQSPPPHQSLPLQSVPEVLSLSWSPQPPPPRSLPFQSTSGVLSMSRSLQELPATPSPLLLSGPDVLPSTRLLPSHSRSLQQLPTRPPRSPTRASRVLTPSRPTQSQVLLLYPHQNPPLQSDPGVLPPTGPPPSQSPPQSSTQLSPSRSLHPPPSQALLPSAGPRAPESSPPESLPVFRSIRCQLALLEAQGIPRSLPDDSRRQPRTMPSKSSPRNISSRGLSVPLGQREHAWLVAVSGGCWAQVRGLFLEEPELALQRDFMSGFTVLHWLAKHGDGLGLQELAAAARQAGLALDVDARSGCGYTPLHLAAIHGHQFVIKVLVLQLGCQVQVRDSSGRRPWEYLGSSTSGEIWQLLEAPRGTIMFPTEPLACSMSSANKALLPAGKAALPACLRPQHGHRAASHRTSNKSD